MALVYSSCLLLCCFFRPVDAGEMCVGPCVVAGVWLPVYIYIYTLPLSGLQPYTAYTNCGGRAEEIPCQPPQPCSHTAPIATKHIFLRTPSPQKNPTKNKHVHNRLLRQRQHRQWPARRHHHPLPRRRHPHLLPRRKHPHPSPRRKHRPQSQQRSNYTGTASLHVIFHQFAGLQRRDAETRRGDTTQRDTAQRHATQRHRDATHTLRVALHYYISPRVALQFTERRDI